MIIDYSRIYEPSGMAAPLEGDLVAVLWTAPLQEGLVVKNVTWPRMLHARLMSPISHDPVIFDKWPFKLPHSKIERVTAQRS